MNPAPTCLARSRSQLDHQIGRLDEGPAVDCRHDEVAIFGETTQAIYEREGPWASECWLGSNLMPNRPNGASRDCSTAAANRGYNGTCVDFCYSKAGWTA